MTTTPTHPARRPATLPNVAHDSTETGHIAPADTPGDKMPGKARRKRRTRARRASFGSTRQLPSGRWQARYLDSDGARRTAPRTFETERAAEDWLATSRADLLRGAWHSPSLGAVSLADYLSDYLAARVDLAPSTLANYRHIAARWLSADLAHPATTTRPRTVNIGSMQLRNISAATVRDWHAAALTTAHARAVERLAASDRRRRARSLHAAREWATAQGLPVKPTGRLSRQILDAWQASGAPGSAAFNAPPTEPPRDAGRAQVTHAYQLLRSVLTAAQRDGLIPANPCQIKGAGQVKSKERTPATPAEIDAIAANMPERYAAAVHVAAWSGLRAGELFGLTRAHVNLTTGAVRVERALVSIPGQPMRFGPPKTTSSHRTVHLPPHVVTILAAHMQAHTPADPAALVFSRPDGQPVHSAARTRMFRKACAPIDRHDLRWHDLRHTGATIAAQAGASTRELQARLGHSTFTAAMIYQHASAERDRDLAQRMSQLAHPAPEPTPPAAPAPTPIAPGRPALRLVN